MSHALDSLLASVSPERAAELRARWDRAVASPSSGEPFWHGTSCTEQLTHELLRAAGVDASKLRSVNASLGSLVEHVRLRIGDAAAQRLSRACTEHFTPKVVDAIAGPRRVVPAAPEQGDTSIDAIRARAARRREGLDEERPKATKPAKPERPRPPPPPYANPRDYSEVAANARAFVAWRDAQKQPTSDRGPTSPAIRASDSSVTEGADGSSRHGPDPSAPSAPT